MANTTTRASRHAPAPAAFDIGDYLAAEERAAKAALGQTFNDLKSSVQGKPATPRALGATNGGQGHAEPGIVGTAQKVFEEHPFLTVGGAALAGFMTAITVVPSKEQQVLKKLAALERAVALHGGDVKYAKPGGETLLGSLFGAVAHAIKPVILHGVTAALAAKSAGESAAEAAAEETAAQQAGDTTGNTY